MQGKYFIDEFKGICKFICRPISWVILIFAAVVLGISVVIFMYGQDFSAPERLVCAGASDIHLVELYITGFIFLVLALAGAGAIITMIDDAVKGQPFQPGHLLLPVGALICGALAYFVLSFTCTG